jgi:hypothetical protein
MGSLLTYCHEQVGKPGKLNYRSESATKLGGLGIRLQVLTELS